MTMIYHAEGNSVVMRKHRDMIVKSCGCHWLISQEMLERILLEIYLRSHVTQVQKKKRIWQSTKLGNDANTLAQYICWNNVLIRAKSRFYCPITQILRPPSQKSRSFVTYIDETNHQMSAVFIIAISIYFYLFFSC